MKIILEAENEGGQITAEGPRGFCDHIARSFFEYHIPSRTEIDQRSTVLPKKSHKKTHKEHIMVSEKHCPKCDRTRPISDFNKSSRDHTGYQSYCCDCSNKIRVEYKEKQIKYKDRFNFVEPEKQPAIQLDKQPETQKKERRENDPRNFVEPIIETKKSFQWTSEKDKILRSNFEALGVSGIYDKSLLPGFSLTEIRHHCQELGLIDQFGLLKKESKKEEKEKA